MFEEFRCWLKRLIKGSIPELVSEYEKPFAYGDLPTQVRQLVDELYKGNRSSLKAHVLTNIIDEIGRSGKCAAIPSLLYFVFDDRWQIAESAVYAICSIMESVNTRGFLRFVNPANAIPRFANIDSPFENLEPDGLGYFESFGLASTCLLGIASAHWNGYVREAAVKKLQMKSDGNELPFLLVRMNDWVSNVRDAANQAVEARLTPEYAKHFIRNFEIIYALCRSYRGNYAGIVDRVSNLLQMAESRAALLDGLISDVVEVRRACFRVMLSLSDSTLQESIVRAASDSDVLIRMLAVREMAKVFQTPESVGILSDLAYNTFMPIRWETLRILEERFPESADIAMKQALVDKNASVRSLAQNWLMRTTNMDVAQNYRDALPSSKGTHLRVVIEGLGEVGRPEDCALILPFTKYKIVKIRISAIRAIAKLDRSAYADAFLNLLADDSSKVSRVSCNILGIKPYIIGLEQIWNVFMRDEMIHVRLNALSLLVKYTKWDIIPYLIYASCDIDETVRLNALEFLNKWLIKSTFINPSSQQLERLNQALTECSAEIPEPMLRRMQFAFRKL